MRFPIFIALGLLAEIIGTVGGFGSSVFFVPLANFFLDFKVVLAVTAVFHVFSNLAKLALFWKHVDHRLALIIGIPSVGFVVLGAYLTSHLQISFAEAALGAFLVIFALAFLFFPKIMIAPSNTNAVIGGGVAGFLAGLLGTGGAIRGATMAAFNLKKEIFVATSAAVDLAVDISRSTVYLRQGYLTSEYYSYIPVLVVVAFLGSYIGKLLLQRFTQDQFRKFVLVLLVAIGILMLFRSVPLLSRVGPSSSLAVPASTVLGETMIVMSARQSLALGQVSRG